MMDAAGIYLIGFIAQLLFTARLLSQWILSEKHKKVITPALFWHLSLLGAALLFIYGYLRNDLPVMFGQLMTCFVYVRNLQIQQSMRRKFVFTGIALVFATFVAVLLFYLWEKPGQDFTDHAIPSWLSLLGLLAQGIFTLRFYYQWLYSERRQQSSLPVGFWGLSLAGSVLILLYGFLRSDPVLIAAHLFGSVVYVRNIQLLRYGKKRP